MKDIKDLDWLEIFLWYKCNVSCSFCYQKDLRYNYKNNISYSDVIRLLDDWFILWKRFVIFSWWEPTLDSNLPNYIEYSKKKWYTHIRVHTNWFMFKSMDYLKNLYDKWLNWVTISVHWYKQFHDNITNVNWSFDIIVKALINFEKLKKIDNSFIFDINTVICTSNYKIIPKLVYFLCKFNFTRSQLVLSYSLDLFKKWEKLNIIPTYHQIIPFLIDSLEISFLFKKKVVLENIPFCVIDSNYWDQILTNIKINKSSITIKEWDIWNTDLTWMLNIKKCNDCSMKYNCRWLPKDYYEIYWDSFIKPIYD